MTYRSLVVAALAFFTGTSGLLADEPAQSLVIATWGGPYEAAQSMALFSPFAQQYGVGIQTTGYTGGLSVFDEPEVPDVIDMLENEAEKACQMGLLKKIEHASLQAAKLAGPSRPLDQRQARDDDFPYDDFHQGAFGRCSVAHLTYSTLVAYDEQAFNGEKPRRIQDLFDLVRFPGKRALQRSPAALFEWAMMAEGVPVSQIYDLLSTERGLRLVGKRLESLRGHIIWWENPAEAVALLESGEAVMASGYNGRFFDAWSQGASINMIWDGQIMDRSVWAISAASEADEATVLAFLRFVLHPERLAHIARLIPYGPVRHSAFRYIGLHPDTGMVMSDHLPTAEHHLVNALHRDTRWYARTSELRQEYFDDWMNGTEELSK